MMRNRWLTRAAAAAVLVVGATALLGSGAMAGPPWIDLTTAGANINYNAVAAGGVGSALYVQGGSGAGTGQFDPFLTLSANTDTEKGYNTAGTVEWDTFTGGGRTHALQAAAIPPVTINGVVYREFSLDANDTGSDDWMSIDSLKIFLDNQNNLTGFNAITNTFASDDGTAATRIYDQGTGTVLMRSQTLTPGSGVSDITVFIPDSLFPANCYYGSQTCGQWVYFYTAMGGLGTSTAGGTTSEQNYNVTGGFEEWRTRLLPVVNVSKTVTLTRTRTFDWTLVKEVSKDNGATWAPAESVNLFNGQSQDYKWRLTWTKNAGTISNPQISGTITVTNPTGGSVISTAIDAVVNSVSDTLVMGSSTSPTVTCPVTFPATLKGGDSFTCTYTAAGSTTDGTNTASAVVENGTTDLTYSSAAMPVVWANATTTDVDNSASINDPNFSGANQTGLTSSGSFTSSAQTFTCGSTSTLTNTATLTEGTSGQTHSSTATFSPTCYGLTVTKTAATTFTRTFDWTLNKEVSIDGGTTWVKAATANLFNGQSQSYLWRLTWTKSAGVDSAWNVTGNIVVTNPAPMATPTVAVTDSLSSSGAATVTCPATTIAANSAMTCTYTKAAASAASQTNTATATMVGIGYTGTAAVTFSSTPSTLVDNSATIADPNSTGFNQTVTASGTANSTTQTFTCGSSTTITNTATLTEGTNTNETHTSSATFSPTCYGLTVTKTAATTFTRTFDWTLNKEISIDAGATWQKSDSVSLFNGQSQSYLWRLTWTKSAGTDSAWAVSGNIVISNNAPIATSTVVVTDSLSIDGAATVTCPATTIAANSSMTCTYSKTGLASGASQTNTATATTAGTSYTGTAAVTFSSTPTTLVDNSATIADPNSTGFNQTVTASGTANSTTQTFTCGSSTTITNTATLTEGTNTNQTHVSSATLSPTCYGLAVTKTANTTFTRTFDWTLNKEVSIDGGTTWVKAATANLFNGQSQSYLWRLTWTKSAGTDSAWAVSGNIVVTNPAPMATPTVAVTDALSIDGAATVTCPATTIAANSSMTCTYSKTGLASAASQTNTATATLAGQTYTGTAAVTFSTTPSILVDNSATIADPNSTGFNQTVTASGTANSSTQTFTCGSSTTITNTATLTEGTNTNQTHVSSATFTPTCYGLTVTKTAVPTFTRTWTWTINKTSSDGATLTLQPNETFVYHYAVTVNATSADSAWAVSGNIVVTNPAPIATPTVTVTDALSISGAATVTCPATTIAANSSMTCTYSKTGLASAASQTNTATATTAGTSYTGTAPVAFTTPTTLTDECISVDDTLGGVLGTACSTDTLPKTFSYTLTFGPFGADCGDHTIPNTATFTTNDTATQGTATWTLVISVPCPTGCTLTQGYWKTHSVYGPAKKTDDTWTAASGSAWDTGFNQDSVFYNSGQSYIQVMKTSPKGGNVYYILAHQYIAALLNIRAGAATTPAVVAALNYAQTFFQTYTPTSNFSKTVRQDAIAAAGTLGSYNEGKIGPGHCSEDQASTAANTD